MRRRNYDAEEKKIPTLFYWLIRAQFIHTQDRSFNNLSNFIANRTEQNRTEQPTLCRMLTRKHYFIHTISSSIILSLFETFVHRYCTHLHQDSSTISYTHAQTPSSNCNERKRMFWIQFCLSSRRLQKIAVRLISAMSHIEAHCPCRMWLECSGYRNVLGPASAC